MGSFITNETTNFLVNGVDISNIFQPLSLGTQYPSQTGYTIGDKDLNEIFAKYTNGDDKAELTGYTIGNKDLNEIFAKYTGSNVGIVWTQRSFPTSGNVNGFATAGNYWIATSDLGSMKKMYVSMDGGVNWNTSSYVPSNPNYTGIAGNTDGTLFCMSNSTKFWSSTDGGMRWTNRGNTPGSGYGEEMVYSSGRFVNIFKGSSPCLTSYSTDGINWYNSTGYNDSNVSWMNLATDGNGNLVATGYKSSISITAYSSDNGTSWTQGNNIPGGPYSFPIFPIVYGNGLWVAVAKSDPYQTAVSSVFPPSWHNHFNPKKFDDITFCSGQNLFYATSGGFGIYKSSNGQNWTQVLSANNAPTTLAYNESQDKFLGVVANKTICYTSL
tara:strand:+ start:53 stop:1201 length:1149 start_codon:yes stop_codon:yes gene_type:complete